MANSNINQEIGFVDISATLSIPKGDASQVAITTLPEGAYPIGVQGLSMLLARAAISLMNISGVHYARVIAVQDSIPSDTYSFRVFYKA